MSWFGSDLKKQLKIHRAAAEDQKNVQESELKSLEEEYGRRMKSIEENIHEAEKRRREFMAKNESSTAALEKKIENMEICYGNEIAAIDEQYNARMRERSLASNEELREIKRTFDNDKRELTKKHDEEVRIKKQEISNMRQKYETQINLIDDESRQILQKREEELANHVSKKATLQKEYNEKLDELDDMVQKIKLESLKLLREKIKEETVRKNEMRSNLLTTQKTRLETEWERKLVDLVHEIANKVDAMGIQTIEVIKFCKDVSENNEDAELELYNLRSIMYDMDDSKDTLKRHISNFRHKHNAYSAIPQEFRDPLFSKVNSLDQRLSAFDDDRASLNVASSMRIDYNRIRNSGVSLQLKLDELNRVNQLLFETRASIDQTPNMLVNPQVTRVPISDTDQQLNLPSTSTTAPETMSLAVLEQPLHQIQTESDETLQNNELHEKPPFIPDEFDDVDFIIE